MKKILVVEDEILLCWSLKQKLEMLGFQVVTAQTGENGINLLKNERFDAVLTDVRLPDINGLSLITIAKKLIPDIQTFVMSAYSEEKQKISSEKNHIVQFFDKPFDLDEISNQILRSV